MGSRAVLALDTYTPESVGIYIHWNGSEKSIKEFLEKAKKVMAGREDGQYAAARLVQVIGDKLGGNTGLGLDLCKNLDCDNGDNGVYVINTETLEITGRHFNL